MNISIVKILFNETWKEWLKSIFERVSEVSIEVCVDERVEGWVKVADPKQDGN